MTDAAHHMPVVRLAPAKLNLTLAVVGRRDDGFHDLHSVFVPLGLHDRLSLAPAGGTGRDTLHVTGGDAGPIDDNLVLRAIAAAREASARDPGDRQRLRSRPGSTSGSRSLPASAAAHPMPPPHSTRRSRHGAPGEVVDGDRRRNAAAMVGSDVPFFLVGGPALVEGRGERVTPLAGVHGHPGILLVTPRVAVRTPDVFAIFDGARDGAGGDSAIRMTSAHLAQELGNGLSATDLVARAGVLASANDLLPAAALVAPGLVGVRRALTRLLGHPIGLSGSGPTLWTLYPSLGDAEAAARTVEAAVAEGTIPTIGDGPPSVIATTIRTRSRAEGETT